MRVASPPKREVLVFGTGAVGAVLGWRLAQQAQVRVSVICRSNYEAIRTNGISLRTAKWGAGQFHPARVCKSPKDLRHVPFDYIICSNKATSSSSYSSLSSVVSEKTVLVSAQNGVGVEAPLQQSYPSHTVLSGIVYIACNQPRPGVFSQTTAIDTHSLALGLYRGPYSQGQSTKGEASLLEFASLDASFRVSMDAIREKWTKQIWNGAFNPVAALSGLNTHQIMSSPRHLELIKRIMKETCQVAQASGVSVDEHIIEQLLVTTLNRTPVVPSMLQDARAGKPMEVEPLCGNVCRLASIYGLKAPTVHAVYESLLEGIDVPRKEMDAIPPPMPISHPQPIFA
ncbi:hypothetical protein Q7P37_005704 [Cladosporium fusiforme]